MSLGLHPRCVKQLAERLAGELPKIRVRHRMFIDSGFGGLKRIEPTLPEGQIKEKLKQYIGESPLLDFAFETLSKELGEGQEYDSAEAEVSLTTLSGYEDPAVVAGRLVNAFESLPWEYTITIKLANDFGAFFSGTI